MFGEFYKSLVELIWRTWMESIYLIGGYLNNANEHKLFDLGCCECLWKESFDLHYLGY